MAINKLSYQCLETVFGDIPAFTFSMKVKELGDAANLLI